MKFDRGREMDGGGGGGVEMGSKNIVRFEKMWTTNLRRRRLVQIFGR